VVLLVLDFVFDAHLLDFVLDVRLLDFIILACLLIPSCLYFSLKDSWNECAFYLVSLPVSFCYEYLMVETIFSQVTYFTLCVMHHTILL
jgi:hypothetical protein